MKKSLKIFAAVLAVFCALASCEDSSLPSDSPSSAETTVSNVSSEETSSEETSSQTPSEASPESSNASSEASSESSVTSSESTDDDSSEEDMYSLVRLENEVTPSELPSIKEMLYATHSNFLLTDDGKLYSYGFNGLGGLGQKFYNKDKNNPFWEQWTGLPHLMDIDEKVEHIYGATREYTFAALTESGKLYGWGNNRYGIIPSEDNVVTTPTLIRFDQKIKEAGISQMFLIVLAEDGNAYYCGWMGLGSKYAYGEIDEYPDICRQDSYMDFRKIEVPGGESVQSVFCSQNYCGVLTESGKVYLLGQFPKYKSPTPKPKDAEGFYLFEVRSPEPIVQVAPGSVWLILLSESGKLYYTGEWGYMAGGEAEDYSSKLIELNFLDDVVEIKGSTLAILARTKDGSIYFWGDNNTYENGRIIPGMDKIVNQPQKLPVPEKAGKMFLGCYNVFVFGQSGDIWGFGLGYGNRFLTRSADQLKPYPQSDDVQTPYKMPIYARPDYPDYFL